MKWKNKKKDQIPSIEFLLRFITIPGNKQFRQVRVLLTNFRTSPGKVFAGNLVHWFNRLYQSIVGI